MRYNNGHPKSGGRKPGTPNKRTQELLEVLDEHGYSPVSELIAYAQLAKSNYKLAADPMEAAQWLKVAISCATGIMPYVYPKRKPSEEPDTLSHEDLSKLPTEELVKMAESALLELKKE